MKFISGNLDSVNLFEARISVEVIERAIQKVRRSGSRGLVGLLKKMINGEVVQPNE